jgi:arylsulfatase A-like enzyme
MLFATTSAGGTQPNILLIVADDLGWADLGCYGADLHETPNLDRFAQQGVRFTQAYSASPVCTPTRASIMTGKHPARLHMTIWHEAAANPPQDKPLIPPVAVENLPLSETTLAEALRGVGYRTAHIGKWHLGEATHYPENQGFDLNVGGTLWGAPPTFFYPYRGLFGSIKEPRYVPRLEGGKPGEYLTDRLTDEALKFIEKENDAPFFVNLCYHSVHTPIEAKEETVEYFRKKLKPEFHHRNPIYAAMVASLDENVGRLLDRLDQKGLAEDTVTVFISDNGGYINDYREQGPVTSNYPLRSGKGSLYEGGVRVPMMIRWPGATGSGEESETPVVTTDLFPTLLAAARTSSPPEGAGSLDGVDLKPVLEDPSATLGRDALYFHYPHYYQTTTPVSAVRSGDWKLLEYFETDGVELYNLKEDLAESKDLSAEHPEKAAELKRDLGEWRRSIGADTPSPNPSYSKG